MAALGICPSWSKLPYLERKLSLPVHSPSRRDPYGSLRGRVPRQPEQVSPIHTGGDTQKLRGAVTRVKALVALGIPLQVVLATHDHGVVTVCLPADPGLRARKSGPEPGLAGAALMCPWATTLRDKPGPLHLPYPVLAGP
ncbi:hypothetical protein GHT09_014141 [Marmota monax]|uniref:Uncharacterized protein n=1 Tax=Marmota monax TaxID=9995 RepID=A0A834PL52_MARMO|nr:hypothetical protein GHT09_014141 [Marmota monax]